MLVECYSIYYHFNWWCNISHFHFHYCYTDQQSDLLSQKYPGTNSMNQKAWFSSSFQPQNNVKRIPFYTNFSSREDFSPVFRVDLFSLKFSCSKIFLIGLVFLLSFSSSDWYLSYPFRHRIRIYLILFDIGLLFVLSFSTSDWYFSYPFRHQIWYLTYPSQGSKRRLAFV